MTLLFGEFGRGEKMLYNIIPMKEAAKNIGWIMAQESKYLVSRLFKSGYREYLLGLLK